MTFLDAKLLAQHRAGRVLALDASAVGASVGLRAEKPERTPRGEVAAGGAGKLPSVVAVIDILGPLAQRGEQHVCGFVDGYDWIEDRLGAAIESAEAVVLRIDSPGGDVAGLDEAVRRMRAAVDAAGIPVVAYVDECAASAAYMLAAGVADEIVVPRSGVVGSIGTFAVFVDATKASEQDGLAVTLVRDPAGKAAGHPLDPVTDVALERLQKQVSASTEEFISAVAARRGLSTTVLRALNGATLRGADAVAAGLADRVGTLEGTIRAAAAPRQQGTTMAKTSSAKAEDPKPADTKPEAPAAAVPVEDGKVTCPKCGETFDVAMPTEQTPPAGSDEAKALAALVSATKASSPLAALSVVAAERAELAQLRAEVDRRRRADIGAELVRAGALPADVWADPAKAGDTEQRAVSALYAAMPLEDLRAQIAKQQKPAAFSTHSPAAASSGLSAYELELCKAHGITPETYTATRAAMAR